MNALVMRLETRADQAAAAGENDLAALLWEAAAAVALSPDQPAKEIELDELRRNLERLPAMAWATLRALGSPAPFDLTQSAATADYWRSEGREVVDLLRRSAVIGIVRDHSR